MKTLTAIEKKSLCEYKAAHPNENHERIAELFQIGKTTVGDILRTKEKWLSIAEKTIAANKKRDRECEWPNIENALVMWINFANRANHTVTGAILVQKALEFAQKLVISDFNASAVSW